MNRFSYKIVILTSFFFFYTGSLYSQQLAFPGAEGYGKYATGGRGGKVIEVTNLNSSGAGSLAAAVAESGARTIVFRVGGTIDADINIKSGNITIAGQTAPGDGITIKGKLSFNNISNVIVRYIRVRGEVNEDAFGGRYNDNIIIDHVSTSWSSDETMSIYHGKNITIQWCMITEAMGGNHAFGGIWGNNHSTYHHNLFAHNIDRNPRIASGAGYNDFRNNVIYNWQYESIHGGEMHQGTDARFQFCSTNVVANYYKPGPGTQAQHMTRICSPKTRNGAADYGKWFVADNYLFGNDSVTADNWKGVIPVWWNTIDPDLDAIPGLKLDAPSEFMPINQQTAEEAFQAVLEYTGCSFPNRDTIDIRIIDEVRDGTATYGNGFVSSPSTVGGWPALDSGTAPTDTDHDGMPDDWEIANGLNKDIPDDRNDTIGNSGYTNLEIYLNSLVKAPSFFYAPIHVTAELTDLTKVKLTWEDTNDDETGFRIERAEGDGGIFDTIAELQADIITYVDSGLAELTQYHYRVVAFNDSLTSSFERIVDVTTLSSTSLPAAVSDPSPGNNALNIGADTTLMWKASVNADSYDVYFGTDNPPPFVINQSEATFKPDGLLKGTRYYWRINGINTNGTTEGTIWSFKVEGTLSSEAETVPNKLIFIRNYPNPFNSFTTINYELKSHSEVKLSVYNVLGENVAILVNQWQTAGEHSVTFDAGNLESGIYFFSIKTDLSEQRGKMLLMK